MYVIFVCLYNVAYTLVFDNHLVCCSLKEVYCLGSEHFLVVCSFLSRVGASFYVSVFVVAFVWIML